MLPGPRAQTVSGEHGIARLRRPLVTRLRMILIAAALVVVLVGLAGWYFFIRDDAPPPLTLAAAVATTTTIPPPGPRRSCHAGAGTIRHFCDRRTGRGRRGFW